MAVMLVGALGVLSINPIEMLGKHFSRKEHQKR